jgi:hypothetical protein
MNAQNSHAVPVPCKIEVTAGVTVPADPKLFDFEMWVKQPSGLVWERVTKQTSRLIIHYMAGEWKQKEKVGRHTQYCCNSYVCYLYSSVELYYNHLALFVLLT